jgi:hypothetical protein
MFSIDTKTNRFAMLLREDTAQDYPDGGQTKERRFAIIPPSPNPAETADRFLGLEEIAVQANSGPGAIEAELERKTEEQREIAELRDRLNAVLNAGDPEISRAYAELRKHNSINDLGQLSFVVTTLETRSDEILRKKSATRPARKKRSSSGNSAYSGM